MNRATKGSRAEAKAALERQAAEDRARGRRIVLHRVATGLAVEGCDVGFAGICDVQQLHREGLLERAGTQSYVITEAGRTVLAALEKAEAERVSRLRDWRVYYVSKRDPEDRCYLNGTIRAESSQDAIDFAWAAGCFKGTRPLRCGADLSTTGKDGAS